jgi:predicted ATPase
MIKRLRVRGYKSLKDCMIEFSPMTVIFGANGAGKSNLFDLLSLISRLASRETVRDAFDGHRGRPLEAFYSAFGFGKNAYSRLLSKERLVFSVECDLELHPTIVEDVNRTLASREEIAGTKTTYTKVSETRLRYRVEVAIHPRSGELFVADESLNALNKDFEPRSKHARQPFFEWDTAKRRYIARIERQGHPRYFDGDRTRTLLSELSDPVYHPHVVAAARELSSWRVYYVEPSKMRAEVGVQAAAEPGRAGELLAAYYYFLQEKHPAVLKGIIRNLRELVSGLEDLHVDVREGLLEIVASHRGGAEYPARLLSEGTLRLLCVLGISVAPVPPATVGFEEPENGVNAARLEVIANILRGAVFVRPGGIQFILTTHSPIVCDLLPEHLVLCKWNSERETKFEAFPFQRESLFFQREVIKALDDTSEGLGTNVVASEPDE